MSAAPLAPPLQDRTEALASFELHERELHSGRHVLESVFYGQDRGLRLFLDLPETIPILPNLTHGLLLCRSFMLSHTTSKWPTFAPNQHYRDRLVNEFGREAYVCGAPFVHFRRIMGITTRPDAEGTVAFPAHSTHFISLDLDFAAYARDLAALPERFHPVTVCLYWKEFMDGHDAPFLDQGLRVVTAGHMLDPLFMERFYGILASCRYVTGNVIGSQAGYAIEMGLPYFLTGPGARFFGDRAREPEAGEGVYDQWGRRPRLREFAALLPRPEDEDLTPSAAARQWVADTHGCDQPIDRDTLRRIIVRQLARWDPKVAGLLRLISSDPTLTEVVA